MFPIGAAVATPLTFDEAAAYEVCNRYCNIDNNLKSNVFVGKNIFFISIFYE